MNNLLNSGRFARLVEQEAIDGPAAYAPAEFLADVRKGVWKELDGASVRIDAYRRNLQRAYLDLVNAKVNSTTAVAATGLPPEFAAASGDEKPLYRAELRSLTHRSRRRFRGPPIAIPRHISKRHATRSRGFWIRSSLRRVARAVERSSGSASKASISLIPAGLIT